MNRSNLKLRDKIIAWSPGYKHYFKVVITKLNSNTFQGETKDVGILTGLKYEQAWKPEEFKKQKPEEYYKLFPEQKLAQPTENDPPQPDDFNGNLEAFAHAWDEWLAGKKENATIKEIYALDQLILSKEKWKKSNSGNGLTYVAGLAPDSPMPESGAGDAEPIYSANTTNTAKELLNCDTPEFRSQKMLSETGDLPTKQILSQPLLPASHFRSTENDSQPMMIETVFPESYPQSTNYSLNSQLSKMSGDSSIAQSGQEATNCISLKSLTKYPTAGTMQNGLVSVQPTLERPGVEKDCLLLRSPGALSGYKSRPSGLTRLDHQLKKLTLTQEGEVAAPEFLENGYKLPKGWTNPEENRTAMDLTQTQNLKSELLPATVLTAVVELPWATPLIGELQQLASIESNTSPAFSNLGKFTKVELLNLAIEAHQNISNIERNEFDLALKKLHQARNAGLCLVEFKRRCGHGEFEKSLEAADIKVRNCQNYMAIAKNWEAIEAKAQNYAFLDDCQVLSINWAINAVRDEKRSLKSAAAPNDPDCWKTPPVILGLVERVLGEIDLDPAADEQGNVNAAEHYTSHDDGLKKEWFGRIFLNPPYSDSFTWVEKCCFQKAKGNVSEAIALLKAGTLNNVGTGELIKRHASAICHWRGRIAFLNEDNQAVKGTDFDCVLVYFGENKETFGREFEQHGTVSYFNTARTAFPIVETKPDQINVEQSAVETVAICETEPTAEIGEITYLNSLDDYVVAVNSNVGQFSLEQLIFLNQVCSQEIAKRLGT